MAQSAKKIVFIRDGFGLAVEGESWTPDDNPVFRRIGHGMTLCTICNRKVNNESKARKSHLNTLYHRNKASALNPSTGTVE